jgi:hypothetical protein
MEPARWTPVEAYELFMIGDVADRSTCEARGHFAVPMSTLYCNPEDKRTVCLCCGIELKEPNS